VKSFAQSISLTLAGLFAIFSYTYQFLTSVKLFNLANSLFSGGALSWSSKSRLFGSSRVTSILLSDIGTFLLFFSLSSLSLLSPSFAIQLEQKYSPSFRGTGRA
jgi:hypothetical protein